MNGSPISCFVVAILLANASPGAAAETSQEPPRAEDGYHRFTVGAYIGLGMAHTISSQDSDDTSPRFAGAGGAYVDFRLAKAFALGVGVDLVGKGSLLHDEEKVQLLFLEIPLGLKIFAGRFALGIALAFDVALFQKTSPLSDEYPYWLEPEENNWHDYERFNLSPRVTLAYAIPIGRVAIVPGIAWSIETMNDIRGDLEGGEYHDWSRRNTNLMLTLGVELGLGTPKAVPAPAPSSDEERRFHRFSIGAYASMGMARYVTDADHADYFLYEDDLEPRFAGGGGAYFDFYLAKEFALDVGIGLVGKGHRRPTDDQQLRLTYLELPLGATLDLWGIRIGLALALEIGLNGTFSEANNGGGHTTSNWGDEQWDSFRRVNFGPRLSLGYAIHLGKIAIVPSAAWSMDILDNALIDDGDDFQLRNMNLMFNLGLEYGFGDGS